MYSWEPILEWKLWIYLICMGVLGMLFQFLLTLAFSMAPSSKAGLTVYLAVLFGGLWGWLIWGEVPTIVSSLGMGLIVLGGTMAMLDNTPSRELK
jgi:drug/metabolite transporter (DMT)-like permease